MTATDAPPLTALVAEASPFGTAIVRDTLARVGIRRVVEAKDGAEALNAVAEQRPDLVVLGWDLPVLGAREVVAALRDPARSPDPAMPIIVTMPQPTGSSVAEAKRLGASTILASPFSPRELRLRLERLAAAAAARHFPA